jgi:hypothetical protein
MLGSSTANSESFKVTTPSLEVRDIVIASGMVKGAGISYDRLEDLVAELQRS